MFHNQTFEKKIPDMVNNFFSNFDKAIDFSLVYYKNTNCAHRNFKLHFRENKIIFHWVKETVFGS